MQKRIIVGVIAIIVLLLALAGYFAYQRFLAPTNSSISDTPLTEEQQKEISTLAVDLDTPWSITVLPDDRLLVTERSGTLNIIGDNNQKLAIADVVETSEGGLLGVAIDPDFADNNYLYVYKTIGDTNMVERYTLVNNELADRTDIITAIPAAANHNGGAIAFGPDDKLYITTGETYNESLAQNLDSLGGKILRLNPDGSAPLDNPFGTVVWSYGHRNPQGLAWDGEGRLWSTEHGPSGSATGHDELNLIVKGGNYGWPAITGKETREGMIAPVAESGSDDTWAPAGLAYHDGALYFAGLRGQTLYKAVIDGNTVSLSRHLTQKYGRLRAVTTFKDSLLVSTSNKDGRGMPRAQDDVILRVPFTLL